MDQCCTLCSKDAKCKSFTYAFVARGVCYFYDNGVSPATHSSFRSAKAPSAPPTPPPTPGSPVWGPGATATPEKFGYKTADVQEAEAFINAHVKQRECFLMAKNGEIMYESGDVGKVFEGYSMTKTIGFLLVLMAATQGELDIDADITEVYGIPSPKTPPEGNGQVCDNVVEDVA